jgi:hypothetical protein
MCVYIRIGKRERRRLENALPLGYNSRAQYQVHRSRGGGGGIGSFGCCWPKSKWIQPLPTAGGKEKRHTTGNKIIKKSRKILWGGFFPFLLSGKIETFLKRKKGIEINPSFSLVNPVNFLLDLWPPLRRFFFPDAFESYFLVYNFSFPGLLYLYITIPFVYTRAQRM